MSRVLASLPARQRGVSLVELMVAMLIGLMLVLMVTSYTMSSRRSYQTSVANQDVQDARRFALSVIQQQIWLSGYSDRWEDLSLLFPSYTPAEDKQIPAFAAGQLAAADSDDEIWVRYRAAELSGQPLTHCDGTSFPSSDGSDADSIAVTGLYLDGHTLRCLVSLSGGEMHRSLPLLNDVEAMRWEYLDDSNAFQSREHVNWTTVRAVRLALILASAESTGERYVQSFPWGEGTVSFEDGRARTRLETTIALRNLPETAQ
ncbi:PilW family protein [Salinicola lusitanus]|uniref:PilW family protein n=1 Tax=Salinicola lusitanus TaxID=1949085 RepID=A0ABZ3CVB5_9GAMM|nr:PilW family protein [Salinicola sp. CR57]